MRAESTQSKDPWTAYWQTGAGSSCFKGIESECHLTQLWDEHVDAMPDHVDAMPDKARMLDLATGNGTVARICAARARARGIHLNIDVIDAAEIDPPACLPDPEQLLSSIHFHGNTRLEALKFRDGTFSSVVSQFGFEHACETRAAAEAARVLAPGGRLRLVIHARVGAVARDIDLRLARMHRVLVENGPVSLALELARAYEAGDVSAIDNKSQHLPAAAELIKRFRDHPLSDDSALFYSTEFLMLWAHREQYNPADLRRSIEDGWTNINDMAIRQEQLLEAVRSEEDMERLQQLFKAFGWTVSDVEKVYDKRNVQIAWKLDACKPAWGIRRTKALFHETRA
jgi:ubiquinone/menaquinone biosynthesis C-methylase UbiE